MRKLLCFILLSCAVAAVAAQEPGAVQGPEAPAVSEAPAPPAEAEAAGAFRFDDKGAFTIMQVTDLHYTGDDWMSHHVPEMLVRLVEQERPDLIVVTGDVIYRRPAEEKMRAICGVLAGTGVPYAVTLGNHDAEQDLSRAEIHALLRTLPGCVNGRYEVSAEFPGDFVIPVLGSEDDREEARIYVMDSNDYNADDHSYRGFEPGQVVWYAAACAAAAERNGRKATGLVFFHVPLREFAEAYRTQPLAGSRLENECPPRDNTGMFRALVEGGEAVGAFAGHDHSNDYVACKEGIALCYGRYSGGYGEYQELVSGVRMIRLREGVRGFTTWVRRANGRASKPLDFPVRSEEAQE